MPRRPTFAALLTLALAPSAGADDALTFEPRVIDPHVGEVCYAVTVADVNRDDRPDIVAVTEDAVVWFANPSWEKHTVIQGATDRDNVCLQARDIDGDGRLDFALGAGWQPTNTRSGGTLQWLRQKEDGSFTLIPIATEPTIHRMRWGDVLGDGKRQLVVAPLQGRGTKGPDWGAGQGVRILVFSVPEDPARDPWPMQVADDTLHTVHNLQAIDTDGDGRDELLLAAWEGVFVLKRDAKGWSRTKIGAGNQEATPFKGSSEVKLGRLADGRPYVAAIEPWHGFQVIVYTPPRSGAGLWDRRVIDEPLAWGHAVWCANLDDDNDQELIIGQRDPSKDPARSPRGPGVFVYDPKATDSGLEFARHVLDDGGMACEDALAADLDGDGRVDVVAGGRQTHNVKVYWNRGGRGAAGRD